MKFEYLEPVSITDAISLLTRYGNRTKVMAGGTDLIVQMRGGVKNPDVVIHIGKISELYYVRDDKEEGLKMGALATIRALEKSDEVRKGYAAISEAASQLASFGIRNMATLGGNLCNASPSADTAPILIGLSAIAKISGPDGERDVLLEDFFTGPGTTVLETGELLTEVSIPPVPARTGATYLKHGIRRSIDLAIVGAAAVITLEKGGQGVQEAKLVLGGVAPTPIRVQKAEAALTGREISEAAIEEAGRLASEEAKPITDVRATAEYRCEMVEVFTKRAIRKAIERAKDA
jgi:carbon-monoxide dehydrogenase medium subunit